MSVTILFRLFSDADEIVQCFLAQYFVTIGDGANLEFVLVVVIVALSLQSERTLIQRN